MKYGLFVWKIKDLPPPAQLVEICKTYHISNLCVKVADGTARYNQVDQDGKPIGNDSYLKGTWIDTLEANGIHVHGWVFPYTLPAVSPGAQAGVAGERVQKLGIRSLKIDIEDDGGGGWKTSPYRNLSCKTYMANLKPSGVPTALPVGLCSYRLPASHVGVPFAQFLKHESMDHNAPQMYWQGSHNPGEQLERCISQYDAIYSLPYEPVGAMYGTADWTPTVLDIKEFMIKSRDAFHLDQVWFWSMDWVWAHKRWDWLETAAAEVAPPAPPPPPQPTSTWEMEVTAVPYVNIRTGPSQSYADVGNLTTGTIILVGDIAGSDAWAQIAEGAYKGHWVCVKQATRYLKVA